MVTLTDKVVVITGSLRPMTRQDAVTFLENQGAIVQNYVSAQTEILIAGHKQLDLFEPDKRSKKYEAVIKRQADGQNITIISEEAFFTLVKESQA
ncbi:BRCT domain-containing protein [Streptococcus pasteurianus]|uniref:BRCT domain-containing protein n=1 Tax=Streptococcus pasteurianus TaxID=197614 RepID=UPI0020BF38C1|nr:BRCT domain-containing protein [Streptococcus pasteurianus]MDV5117061.1 BRCT domain-containing protein [Streptococcus pasteurianus]MDV5154903.1 BRCT domain-containing protein [Streptococcus pasteurianus]MDV5163666.1 BRCT domain-containing protein [Streptococcus pasteurianus]WCQ72038.1 BRCT domain-containing protein [Streptococcus pasteurianus]